MISRRLLVRSDNTIGDLHYTLQIAFGWSDSHLHRFHIHGKDYGVGHRGGLSFDDDPQAVHLADFQFRVREPLEPQRIYPLCLEGKRSAPSEDCGGVRAFLKGRLEAPWRAHELLKQIAGARRRTTRPPC